MIAFDSQRTSFGRHETFPLRYGWLTKGFRFATEGAGTFEQDDATVLLGVGKNMVSAIRYWLCASQMASNVAPGGIRPTQLGNRILAAAAEGPEGWDPYLEDDTTLWLIHWLIASNPTEATSFYWFFNRFHKPEFSVAELLNALKSFVKEDVAAKVAETTLKHDVGVLLRMYVPSDDAKSSVEDKLDSPLSTLGLVRRNRDGKIFASTTLERRRVPVAAFGYAVLDYLEGSGLSQVPIELLMRASPHYSAPGSVFRLSEERLVAQIEEFIRWMPGFVELRDTAGVHQLYEIQKCSKFDVLSQYYDESLMEHAA